MKTGEAVVLLLTGVVSLAVDHALRRFLPAPMPGVLCADPITIVAVAATVTAATAVTTGVLNYMASQDAANAQKDLAAQQAAQLKKQQDDASALAAQQAISGQTFGGQREDARAAATGLGFGSGQRSATGYGRSQLTGG